MPVDRTLALVRRCFQDFLSVSQPENPSAVQSRSVTNWRFIKVKELYPFGDCFFDLLPVYPSFRMVEN